jgi:hypothetical protein
MFDRSPKLTSIDQGSILAGATLSLAGLLLGARLGLDLVVSDPPLDVTNKLDADQIQRTAGVLLAEKPTLATVSDLLMDPLLIPIEP